MARPRKKQTYDAEQVMNELLDTVVKEYNQAAKDGDDRGVISSVASELEIAPHKVRKLLVTAGIRDNRDYYNNAISVTVQALHKEGKTVAEIMDITSLSRTSVCCYLPYSKGIYNAKELSLTAERLKRYRSRQERCRNFMKQIACMSEDEADDYLWETLECLQGCIFRTVGRGNSEGSTFRYVIKGGEMFVDRKDKSITKSTILLAFAKAREIQKDNGFIAGPKKIGTFGASYLYPIFLRLGVCTRSAEPEAK